MSIIAKAAADALTASRAEADQQHAAERSTQIAAARLAVAALDLPAAELEVVRGSDPVVLTDGAVLLASTPDGVVLVVEVDGETTRVAGPFTVLAELGQALEDSA